jgi:endonuclease/exonuclease/phosphatase family metal-dependent hydrolase
MRSLRFPGVWGLWILAALHGWLSIAQDLPGLVVAKYTVENYLLTQSDSRPIKPMDSRKKVQEALIAIRPDVLALQEIGETNALLELQSALRQQGLNLPHWEHVRGYEQVAFVRVLSRYPIVKRVPHTNLSYLIDGRRFKTSRGIAEVEIAVSPTYRFTLLNAHFKSKRPLPTADEATMRHQEALLLRRLVDAKLTANPQINLLVCGDFNDNKDAPSIRSLIGRGRKALIDTRPSERNGDDFPATNRNWDPRTIAWTHYFGREDIYSRIDYILLSSGMAKEWRSESSYVYSFPNWGQASDHRPVVAGFIAKDQ